MHCFVAVFAAAMTVQKQAKQGFEKELHLS